MRIRFQLLILAALTLLCYLPFVKAPFIWDDQQFVTDNVTVQTMNVGQMFRESTTAGANIPSNYFRPLTSLSFAIDAGWWGKNPLGFHLTNLVLHISAGLLLFWLLTQIGVFKRWRFWITAFFLLHPVQTEAVQYISSRGDSLSAVLSLLGLNLFWLGLTRQRIAIKFQDLNQSIPRWLLLVASALFYILAVLAKELALASIGWYGLLLAFFALRQKQTWQKTLKSHWLPTITVAVLLSFGLLYAVLRQTSLNFYPNFDYSVISPEYATHMSVRLLTFTRALPRYFGTFLFPLMLHMDHVIPVITSVVSPWPWISLGLVSLLITLGILEQRRLGSYWIAFGGLWFLIGLVPVSGIVPVNGLFYEHWLYLPIIGLLLIFATVIRLLKSFAPLFTDAFNLLAPLLLFAAIILTIRQNYLWSDPIRFYQYTLRFNQTARLHNNLAMAFAESGQVQAALTEYQNALEISPGYPQIYHNMGNIYANQQQYHEALTYYLKAIEVDPTFVFSYPKALTIAEALNDASTSALLLQSAETYVSPAAADQLRQLVQ